MPGVPGQVAGNHYLHSGQRLGPLQACPLGMHQTQELQHPDCRRLVPAAAGTLAPRSRCNLVTGVSNGGSGFHPRPLVAAMLRWCWLWLPSDVVRLMSGLRAPVGFAPGAFVLHDLVQLTRSSTRPSLDHQWQDAAPQHPALKRDS